MILSAVSLFLSVVIGVAFTVPGVGGPALFVVLIATIAVSVMSCTAAQMLGELERIDTES